MLRIEVGALGTGTAQSEMQQAYDSDGLGGLLAHLTSALKDAGASEPAPFYDDCADPPCDVVLRVLIVDSSGDPPPVYVPVFPGTSPTPPSAGSTATQVTVNNPNCSVIFDYGEC